MSPSMSQLRAGYRAVVIGSTGALGAAFVAHLRQDPRCERVFSLSRTGSHPLELEDEASIQAAAECLREHGPIHLVIDATGALTLHGQPPEKRLDDLTPGLLAQAFAVNAVGPALLLKHMTPLLASGERVIWAKLSARVGSIADNRKGGWYGYRASKAALNMLLQTAAIEIARRRPMAVIAALQPGTVRSRLSEPFVGDQGNDPTAASGRLLQVLDRLTAQPHAQFVDHQGHPIPW